MSTRYGAYGGAGVFCVWSTMTHIAELKPDSRNARKHNPRNVGMIEDSLQRDGFGRSVLLANDGTIIAGNATIDAAAQAGIEDVLIVESDGTKVVAVKRTDVEPDSERFHMLALADNRTAELAEWDEAVLAELNEELDLSGLFNDDELARILSMMPGEDDWKNAMGGLPDSDRAPFQQMTFTVSDEQAEQVNRALSAAKQLGAFANTGNENSNGNALARICEAFLNG